MQGEASTRLGFTDFRVELAWAKLLGAVLLRAPVPARLKEWGYAAFAITLGSALIAHLSIGEGARRRAAGRRCQRPQTALSRQRLRRSSRLTSRNLGEPINNGPFTLPLGSTSCGNRPVRRAIPPRHPVVPARNGDQGSREPRRSFAV